MPMQIFLHSPEPDDANKLPIHHYFPGTVITGTLVLELSADTECQCLSLTLSGKATTSFVLRPENTRCSDTETVLNSTKILHPGGKIEKGRFTYPFEMEVPLGIPSTFKTLYGQINYEIIGELNITNELASDIKEHQSVLIYPQLDLNKFREDINWGPLEKSDKYILRKKTSCLTKLEFFYVKLVVPRRLFRMKEPIRFKVEMTSGTRRRVTLLKMQLCKRFSFKGKDPADGSVHELNQEEVCAEVKGPKVLRPMGVSLWKRDENFLLKKQTSQRIPHLTGLGGACQIIDLQYFIRLTIKFKDRCYLKTYEDIVHEIPIIIGNVRIKDPTYPKRLSDILQWKIKKGLVQEEKILVVHNDNIALVPSQEPTTHS